jgi:hypothetical protein
MKKILMVIALAAIGLTVVPQVQAQDQAKLDALERELAQMEARIEARGGQPTAQEVQRIQQIRQEIIQAMGSWGSLMQTVPQQQPQELSPQQMQQQQQQQMQQWQQMQQQQTQPQQRDTFPAGNTSGWPSSSTFSQYSLPALRQPAGTTTSYSYRKFNTANDTIIVYIKGGTQSTIDELVRQIQAGTASNLWRQNEPGIYMQNLPKPSNARGMDGYRVEIELQDGGVVLLTRGLAG